MNRAEERAYGKLNLSLDIIGKRPDGFHDLRMVMHSVDLSDTVTVFVGGSGPLQVLCDDPAVPGGADNLCAKAARVFCEEAGRKTDGIRIELEKHIPMQAGMAGGSSDAAAVLRALNRLSGHPFSPDRLARMGASVGSDVPYCVYGGTALAEGRGERITPLDPLPEACFVLCQPDFSVSTPVLFHRWDSTQARPGCSADAMTAAVLSGQLSIVARMLHNDFEQLAAVEHPVICEIRDALLENGAMGARMTGTGSVVYGMFGHSEPAAGAAAVLEKRFGFRTVICGNAPSLLG